CARDYYGSSYGDFDYW
nr:immunoglobulin heavy chain junction region [Mus musculus]